MAALKIPHLKRTKTSAQLIIKGKPFLMLPCETHNSSFSSSAYMDCLWAELKNCNFNTILGSVSWESIEPHEGHFDFTELDRIILAARGHGLHLVLLWFGAYKNGTSSYAPGWVKRDFGRFPRVRILGGDASSSSSSSPPPLKTVEVLSPFSQATWEADGRAFAALLQHVRDIDEEHSTVLMVQVKNECGVLGDSRDRSRLAEEAFAKPVPHSLLQYLAGKEEEEEEGKLHPQFEKRFPGLRSAVLDRGVQSWEEVFGQGELADEMLMAAAYANFLGKVCEAGKREYSLPMFANVWLNMNDPSFLDIDDLPGAIGEALAVAGGTKPGAYPSGGPCPHVMDIYRFPPRSWTCWRRMSISKSMSGSVSSTGMLRSHCFSPSSAPMDEAHAVRGWHMEPMRRWDARPLALTRQAQGRASSPHRTGSYRRCRRISSRPRQTTRKI
jgi:hypothetical protein